MRQASCQLHQLDVHHPHIETRCRTMTDGDRLGKGSFMPLGGFNGLGPSRLARVYISIVPFQPSVFPPLYHADPASSISVEPSRALSYLISHFLAVAPQWR